MNSENIYDEKVYQLSVQISCNASMQDNLAKFVKFVCDLYVIHSIEYTYPTNKKISVTFTIRLPAEFETAVSMVCEDLKVDKNIVIDNYKICNRRVVLARECIVGVLRYRYKYSILVITKLMKAKNHASAIRTCKMINKEILLDPRKSTLFQFYQEIKQHHRNFSKVCKND